MISAGAGAAPEMTGAASTATRRRTMVAIFGLRVTRRTMLPISVFVSGCRCTKRAARLLHQIGLDEGIEVTIEHAVHVADFHLRAVVLDHLIRLQNVTPDL